MSEIGIRKTHDRLRRKLGDYIKAQYFAENDLLMDAGDELLAKKEVIYQEPYIEVTKNFKQAKDGFKSADIGKEKEKILQELINKKLGVFATPFLHQIHAVEDYYHGKNIMVTTGTGSGKTECFLWPILMDLIIESQSNLESWNHEGIRALVLYPMNALVSDQLGRMRSIIGREDDAYNTMLCNGRDNVRRARFGMYTGRTPYAGEDDEAKNKNLGKLIKKNYINASAYDQLKKIGRIPSKNLEAFVACLEKGTQNTSPQDSEVYTRGEMHHICPDILITNYSMLEYMLMRPIEDSFWLKTIGWLNENEENKLLLVIDEAHMYRGASGGEVSLLIRRLMDKLCIEPSKVKCILTSASMPTDKDLELQKFACNLTGKNVDDTKFSIVREEIEKVIGNVKGDHKLAEFFSSIDLVDLQGDLHDRTNALTKISKHFNWGGVPNDDIDICSWLYERMEGNSLMLQVIYTCSIKGLAFSEIAKLVFEPEVSTELAEAALEILLQLGIMSKSKNGKVLLGSKVHMMFKGLQGIYACTNPDCHMGHSGMGIKLGHITNLDIDECPYCKSRMFELIMDRRCGTLSLRAFIDDEINNLTPFDFLWTKKNQIMRKPKEIHLWLMPENRDDFFKLNKKKGKAKEHSSIGYMDSKTGLLFREESHEGEAGYIKVLISNYYSEDNEAYSFSTCPNCGKDYNRNTSFITRGNEPFANIVKEQFDAQIAKDLGLTNEGKKVLLFSDSRQRAATLARDMTISSDGDAGRQAIFMAQKLLENSFDGDSTLDLLYYAFLKIVHDNKLTFFYGEEKEMFKSQLKKYEEFYSDRPKVKYSRMRDKIGNPPIMFYQLLLKNISDNYRSFNNLGLGQVVLVDNGEAGEDLEYEILEKIELKTGLCIEDIRSIYNTWLQYLLVSKIAIFPEIGDEVRDGILAYERGGFGIDEIAKFPTYIREILEKRLSEEQMQILLEKIDGLTQILQSPGRNHNRRYVFAARLVLKTEENSEWYKCHRCAGVSTYSLWGHCIYCGSDQHIHKIDEEHLKRYSLWRTPVLNAVLGSKIRNISTEEHTAQLSYKDIKKDVWVTTEKHELAFRNITLDEDDEPIDVLSCTTTMEVGIDIGSLTSVGLRNVPPMRENYQQRAGRAGRAGAAVSSIVTYTENGPHDAWYFKHPSEIISGVPRTPWIDASNIKLIKRHINLVLLQEYFRIFKTGLDSVKTINFFDKEKQINYYNFLEWVNDNIPLEPMRTKILVPIKGFEWNVYKEELEKSIYRITKKVEDAPFIYTPTIDSDDSRSNSYRLMDVLFTEGLLPNYSFPRNIVHFWIEDLNGIVQESPERSIDIALSEYAPGRSLVVNKQTYISGGLFDYYTKFQKDKRFKAAEAWLELDEYKKTVYCCTNKACGWFGVNENYEECPLCKEKLNEKDTVKPWGFAAREGRNIPETHENQEMFYASQPSYSSMPSGGEMIDVGVAGYIRMENRENQKMVMVNKGPEEKGFELCKICGAIEPSIVLERDRNARRRPYRIPYMKDDTMKCRHEYSNAFLGYEFNTDMMVLELKLDNEKLDLEAPYTVWLIPALTSFAETLALAASRELDVEFGDMKSGFRIRTVGNNLYADIYLYDSLSSGAGYSVRVSKLINSVFKKMEDIFTSCNCSTSCPNCLQHFWNQRERGNLDRLLGSDFLEFLKTGRLKIKTETKEQEKYFEQVNHIARLQGYDKIIYKRGSKYYLKSRSGDVEILAYPSMCSLKLIDSYNKICISDRMCKYALADVWQTIAQKL
ncbi:MAG: hypothetical protein CVV02_03920 [Firmicutes bacterium HGW-Firmicutes-7]|nr:MAG: hypothetical protein CVV02_03920 [Firmicutes bacterium HGW-Firmicutes-7]